MTIEQKALELVKRQGGPRDIALMLEGLSLEKREEIISRFWSLCDVGGEGCWNWRGPKSHRGYGRFSAAGHTFIASRFSAFVAGIPNPEGKPLVCHSCDNPSCVNPSHLWWGDGFDNMSDAASKGRIHFQRRAHCPHGHPLSGDNLRIVKGNQRRCHACTIEYQRRRREKARLAIVKKEAVNG